MRIHFKNHLTTLFFALLFGLLLLPLTVSAEKLFPIGNLDIKGVDAAAVDEGEPLPPEQAFALTPPLYDGKQILFRWDIAPHYYLYRDKLKVRVLSPGMQAGELQLPAGETKQDEFFGTIQAMHNTVDAQLPLDLGGKTGGSVQLEIGWQGCAEDLGVCYPPELKYYSATLPEDAAKLAAGVTLEPTAAPAAGTAANPSALAPSDTPPVFKSEQDTIADTLASGNIPLTLLSFLGFGLILAFTPCVFPMIPILSGIIAGQKNLSTRKAFTLSLVYVLAMALTYTVAGVLAGLFGSNLQAIFQNPWILGAFSAIFVLLALPMFGFYELQMPASIQSRLTELSNKQSGGTLTGVAIMGMLSALIVGPCVAAPLAGALIYIGQSGNAFLGGAALFALSLGMGLPLLLIGTSAGKLLPRAGAWMEAVKAVFGVLLLGVAIWMLERVLPAPVTLLLWAALLVVSAIFMGALANLPDGSNGWRKLWKGLGILMLVYGIALVVGAVAGSKDVFQPLKGVFAGKVEQHLNFRQVSGVQNLAEALAQAKGKPVMLDFYADWCVSCKEMEAYTFPDPAVQAALKGFVLLQTDVTANTADDKALLKQFGLVGPPAMLFFDASGEERKNLRLVGYVPAAPFAAHVGKVGK